MTDIQRTIEGELLGLDANNTLVMRGSKLIMNHNASPKSERTLEIDGTGMLKVNGAAIAADTGSYDHTASGLAATTVQGAIDELSASGAHPGYDHTISGLAATTVKTAIDELAAGGAHPLFNNAVSGLAASTVKTAIDELAAGGAHPLFNNAVSGLAATTVKTAIDELAAGGAHPLFNNAVSGLAATTVKAAIDELAAGGAHPLYNHTISGLAATTLKTAIDELAARAVVDSATTSVDASVPGQVSINVKSSAVKLIYGLLSDTTAGQAWATVALTTTGNAVNNETLTIGTHVYTWKGTLTGAADEILVGAAATNSLDNLVAAVNGAAGAGTTYGTGTTTNTDVVAVKTSASVVTLNARASGTTPNAVASTETMTNASFGAATLTGGTTPSNLNNYNPMGIEGLEEIRFTGAAMFGLTGIAAQVDRFELRITNQSDFIHWITHEDTNSTAANRFATPNQLPLFILPGDTIVVKYNNTFARWLVAQCPMKGTAMGCEEWSDVLFGGIGVNYNAGTGASAGGNTGGTAAQGEQGALSYTTGTTTTGSAGSGSFNGAAIIPNKGQMLSVARMSITTLPDGTETFGASTGFHDLSSAVPVTDGAYFELRWNGAAAECAMVVANNTARFQTVSNAPTVDTNQHTYAVYINAAGTRVDFVYGADSKVVTPVCSVNQGLPNATARAFGWVAAEIRKSAGTTARLMRLDFAGYRLDSVRT